MKIDSKIIEKIIQQQYSSEMESLDLPLEKCILFSAKEKNISEDISSRFEEFSLSSEGIKTQKNLEKGYEFDIETINSEKNTKATPIQKIKTKKLLSFSEKSSEISNSKLRKKVCLKMYQVLQESYHFEKTLSHKIVLNLESKIRNLFPKMRNDYKQFSINVMRIIKAFF